MSRIIRIYRSVLENADGDWSPQRTGGRNIPVAMQTFIAYRSR
jgi:hypothetical protein